jgi:uncharacterized membrane protein
MAYLVLGLALFAVPHLFSMIFPHWRDSLQQQLGEGGFKGTYAALSLAGVAIVVWGYHLVANSADAGNMVYEPAPAMRHVTMLLVLLGFILVGASHGKGYLKLWLRNPMSLGVTMWAGGHLLSNGRVYDVYLFGTFLAIAVLDIILATARGKVPQHLPRLRSDIIAVVVGVVLYAVFLFGFHPYILGLPVLK